MKKILISLMLALKILCINSYATDFEDIQLPTESISGETRQILSEFGLENAEDIENFSIANMFSSAINIIKSGISKPIKLFGLLTAVAILSALYNLFCKDNGSFASLAGMLAACSVITGGIVNKIQEVSAMLTEGSDFVMSFVPVMTAVTSAGGNPVTATAYNMLLIFASNVALCVSTGAVTSLCGCYLAVSLVSGFGTTINLNSLANGIKKAMIWGMGIISTIFVGILSIQGIAGKAADSVALKTAKFALSSSIPIVGSALSEALTSVEGSFGVLRTTVGTFGIIVGVAVVLPVIIDIVLTKLSIEAAAIFAEMIGSDRLGNLYKSAGTVMTVLIALVMFFILVLLVATTVVMLICS